jgi:hypothetical protein
MVRLHFGDVEVIELPPFITSPQRGNRRFISHRFRAGRKQSRYEHRQHHHGRPTDNAHSEDLQDEEHYSSIGLDRIGQQNRTIVDFETYEEGRRIRKQMTVPNVHHDDNLIDGQTETRAQRLTQRVRNRM